MYSQRTKLNDSEPKFFLPLKGGVWHWATTTATFEDFVASLVGGANITDDLYHSVEGQPSVTVSIPFDDGSYAEVDLLIASLTFRQFDSDVRTKAWQFIAPTAFRPTGWTHKLFKEIHCLKGTVWFDAATLSYKGCYNIHWQPAPIDWDANF